MLNSSSSGFTLVTIGIIELVISVGLFWKLFRRISSYWIIPPPRCSFKDPTVKGISMTIFSTWLNNFLLMNWFVISVRWPSRSFNPAISIIYVSSTPTIDWMLGRKVSDYFLWPILKARLVTSSLYSMTHLIAGLSTYCLLPPIPLLLFDCFFSSSTCFLHKDYGPCSMAESRVDLPQPVSPITRIPRLML